MKGWVIASSQGDSPTFLDKAKLLVNALTIEEGNVTW
jgi:hypothetical protein